MELQHWKDNSFHWFNTPVIEGIVSSDISFRENKLRIKSSYLKSLEQKHKLKLQKNECSRTAGQVNIGGVSDWKNWCNCNRSCGNNFSYIWLHHIRVKYHLKKMDDQLLFCHKYVQRTQQENNKYFLPLCDKDSHKKQQHHQQSTKKCIEVCRLFFITTLKIGNSKLSVILDKINNIGLEIQLPSTKGKYNRNKDWKKKVNIFTLFKFVKQQSKSFSHYTRKRQSRRPILYFTQIHSPGEFFNKYKLWCKENNFYGISRSSVQRYYKKYIKQYIQYQKPRLDACETCIKLFSLISNSSTQNKQLIKKLHIRHLLEADSRYLEYKEDKNWSSGKEEKNIVINEDEEGENDNDNENTLSQSSSNEEINNSNSNNQVTGIFILLMELFFNIYIYIYLYFCHLDFDNKKWLQKALGFNVEGDSNFEEEKEMRNEDETSDIEQEWEVESIFDECWNEDSKQMSYQIKWKGYEQLDWIPFENLTNCNKLLREYFKKNSPVVLVKDMQKELGLPELQPQPAAMYRARQLHIHNYGIYDCNQQKMNSWLWNEYQATKKGDDICSVLWQQIQPYLNQNKHLIQWSDNCVSQNSSWKVLNFHLWLVETGMIKRCTLRMLLKGHTFNICDIYFGNFERKCAKRQLLTQHDYSNRMSEVNNSQVFHLNQEEFFNFNFLKKLYVKKR